jgi:hypothetical protein
MMITRLHCYFAGLYLMVTSSSYRYSRTMQMLSGESQKMQALFPVYVLKYLSYMAINKIASAD